jgi:Kef-type K+ transport system membrane component KefB
MTTEIKNIAEAECGLLANVQKKVLVVMDVVLNQRVLFVVILVGMGVMGNARKKEMFTNVVALLVVVRLVQLMIKVMMSLM